MLPRFIDAAEHSKLIRVFDMVVAVSAIGLMIALGLALVIAAKGC